MSIYGYEEAFGGADKTTAAMKTAMKDWSDAYYGTGSDGKDPCQRIAYTVVSKLVRTVFGEYRFSSPDEFARQIMETLDGQKKQAMQLTLVGGSCFLKPCPRADGFGFTLIPRENLLIFGRDAAGVPTDVGTAEKSTLGNFYYTLLERRSVDEAGYLTLENKLYRSGDSSSLGSPVPLNTHPDYADLPEKYRFPEPLGGVGLVQMKMPIQNCIDGSADGVSVYAAAMDLIENIDRNEYLLDQEFELGQSRVFTSSDLLEPESRELKSNLFVGLNEDMEHTGLTVFNPALREAAYIARKQEYLRNMESIIGLRRGMLCDANEEKRTATEVSSSAGDYNLTVIDLQSVWEQAVRDIMGLCILLGKQYKVPGVPGEAPAFSIDWGNGILYDEDKTWEAYRAMVSDGLLKPEIALGWRFGMPAETPEEQTAVRKKYMPENC